GTSVRLTSPLSRLCCARLVAQAAVPCSRAVGLLKVTCSPSFSRATEWARRRGVREGVLLGANWEQDWQCKLNSITIQFQTFSIRSLLIEKTCDRATTHAQHLVNLDALA